MTIKDIVRRESQKLKFVTHIPAKEVEMLICFLLDKNTIWLHLNYNNEFTKEKELIKLVDKRATNYPMEYIINKASFYGENFTVREGVLIPRPETEITPRGEISILLVQVFYSNNFEYKHNANDQRAANYYTILSTQ